jgi:hypothetical protein
VRRLLRAGLRRGLDRLAKREVIGQEECPMMVRWQFFNVGWLKAMIHYFPPEVSDRDPHDHPRSFVTLVLRGAYRDESWDWNDSKAAPLSPPMKECVSAGAIRYRPAQHLHVVETDRQGCWTLVVMGPVRREWGFVKLTGPDYLLGRWFDFQEYIRLFGGVTRCESEPTQANPDLTYRSYKSSHPNF